MIDHILGRPSISWKRTQVILVVIFWLWRILNGERDGPRLLWIRRVNKALKRFTPWQLIVGTLTSLYALRNLDKILGLAAPEPLANLYSPSYYRATWIATGLDVGFATAMPIRPQWLKDICSVIFSAYYIVYANEADEKLRKFRAVPTVEMLRTTWEKTTNPYIRMFTVHPRISIRRKMLLARPKESTHRRPITAWLFFAPPADQLALATDLILDFPGGGFVSMTPEHHEERLRMWAIRTGRPVLSVDYGKAPEYPYPFCIDECFDLYRVLVETTGMVIGMSGHALNIVCTGDSAGAHIAVSVMFKILETQMNMPHPLAIMLNYAALDFNFTSWMTPQNLKVLQAEQSSGHLSLLPDQKDHLRHISPLSMVAPRRLRRKSSLRDTLRQWTGSSSSKSMPQLRHRHTTTDVRELLLKEDAGAVADTEDESPGQLDEGEGESDRPVGTRIRFNPEVSEVHVQRAVDSPSPMDMDEEHEAGAAAVEARAPIGTRLTMTSRTGYFQDRIIPPSMMRAMAILFIGPHRNPDFQSDYQLSPILAPAHLLARFPPLLMSCGEKDPFVDDTLIFAGRVREAKRARRAELAHILATPESGSASGSGRGAPPSLRMSRGADDEASDEARARRAMRREHARLARESEDDWVRVRIFSEWSHGYLQMPTLMREVRGVIDGLADWIDGVFARNAPPPPSSFSVYPDANAGVVGTEEQKGAFFAPYAAGVWPPTASASASETELDTDEVLSFAPRRRSPPSAQAYARRRDSLSALRRASPSTRSPPAGSASASTSGNGGAQGQGQGQGQGKAKELAPSMISESELMRRRRLLDSHLISSQESFAR